MRKALIIGYIHMGFQDQQGLLVRKFFQLGQYGILTNKFKSSPQRCHLNYFAKSIKIYEEKTFLGATCVQSFKIQSRLMDLWFVSYSVWTVF